MKVDILNKLTNGLMREDDYPADKQWQIVGQRCGQNGQTSSLDATRSGGIIRLNNYSEHYVPTGASALQLIYSGMALTGTNNIAEHAQEPNVFEADKILTMTGGTGYVIGEVLTFANVYSGANDMVHYLDPIKVMITSVASGVPLTAQIVDGGIYPTPFTSSGVSPITLSSLTLGSYSNTINGYIATAVTTEPHNLLTGAPIVISGATPSGYNGSHQVKVVDATSFTFFIASALTSPATGTITATNIISQKSTTGSGTGASFTFDWTGYAAMGHIGIEPDATIPDTFTGEKAVVVVKKGIKADGTIERKIKIPMGGFWESDLIPVDVPIGGKIGIRATFTGGNLFTGRVPNNTGHGATVDNEQCFKGTNWVDYSNSVVISASMGEANSSYLFQPAAIMGIPKKKLPVIWGFGDSRTVGSGSGQGTLLSFDGVDDYGNVGCFERALSQEFGCFYPWTNHSRGGIKLDSFFVGNTTNLYGHQQLLSLIAKCKPTAVYLYLGTNDIFGGASFDTIQGQEQRMIALLRGCGVKYVFTSTMEPETTSTDSYATYENQTITYPTREAIRVLRNDGLMAGTYANYDFVVDNRLVAEPSINFGKWIVNGTANYATGDGVHASHEIHRQQAIGIANAIKANIPL